MKFLKGLVLSLLGFLLLLSLSIFATTFTLNSTILNPDFLTSELDKLDVSSLAGEIIEQIPEEAFPEELRPDMIDTIDRLEAPVKEQVNAIIYSIFDYLLGEKEETELVLTLRNTILNSDFVAPIVDELDISSLAGEFLSEQLAEEIPTEMEFLSGHLDDIIAELEPTIKKELIATADPIFDYLLGESQSLSVVISLEPVMEGLKDPLREAFLESPPPELAAVPPAVIEQAFNEFYREFTEQMPPTFELDETLFPAETPTQIAESLAEVEESLTQVRQYVSNFQLIYRALIGFIVLLILGIIFINRQVRNTTRSLGSIFLAFAVPACLSIAAIKYFDVIQAWILRLLNIDVDIPTQLQALILQLVNDFVAPIWILSLVLLAAGVALLIVSYVYKPR